MTAGSKLGGIIDSRVTSTLGKSHWGPRNKGRILGTFLSLVLTVSFLAPAPAEAAVYAGGGKRGRVSLPTARCDYRVFVRSGVLQVTSAAPTVKGPNIRAGRIDRRWARYRLFLMNNAGRVIQTSTYSAWLRVRDDRWKTWSGSTMFSAAWDGAPYWIDVRVEWWNSKRQIGWEAHRIYRYLYTDEYNAGPYGPFSSCYRVQAY